MLLLPNLAGELYWENGKRNFYDALSHLKTDDPMLKFAIFSLYEVDMPFIEQIKIMKAIILKSDKVSIVEGMNAYSHLEVEHYCQHYLKDGWEGAVIKPLQSKTPESWIKYKPDETLDLYAVGVSKTKNAIAVGLKDGTILGHCSLLGRKEIAERVGKYMICGENREDYLINPDLIVEVKHLGVIQPSGHLRSPRVVRIREDLNDV